MLKILKGFVLFLVYGILSIGFLYNFHYSGDIGELLCGIVILINAILELIMPGFRKGDD